ncbi:unnamed protein product [Candidula unifasciata]|uniref:EGF-like domain-containing protein n=1 Tax=Candidula unifasciata TaxID=100452 RepID=A0A8S3Z8X5_9EUPU|nr:unnamed protein product [Candidula unifasciata]
MIWPVRSLNEQKYFLGSIRKAPQEVIQIRKRRLMQSHLNDFLLASSLTCVLITSWTTDVDCPARSSCRPDGCNGYVCLCSRGYVYDRRSATCEKGSPVGESCAGGEKCLSVMAICQRDVCQCQVFFRYVEEFQKCSFPSGNVVGERCNTKDNCSDPNSDCIKGFCACAEGYRLKTDEEYWVDPMNPKECVMFNSSLTLCKGKLVTPNPPADLIPAGEPCTGPNQCVSQAYCTANISGVCTCDSEHYNDKGKCGDRRVAGSTCFGTGQCVVNSECSSTMGGTCDCRSGYYESGGICVEAIWPTKPCTAYGQCVDNAECGVGTSNVCDCNEGFFANVSMCHEVIPPGLPCSGAGQCVTQAQCLDGVCRCDEGFYSFRSPPAPGSRAAPLMSVCPAPSACEWQLPSNVPVTLATFESPIDCANVAPTFSASAFSLPKEPTLSVILIFT